ncbi:peroxisome biogenesis factor 10 [Pieris rapae]|uniref:peroxisome biogenesis factor 10 n=1 Tax=Pieris rapae TaxID=64459 RepID=UPI001E27FF67|nr:peroxisome biogenesis factor 10 [Pieris rapae]
MALPTAQPAEVLRAWQKDNLYEKKLSASLAKLISSQHASKTIPFSFVLYKSFTTLRDLQTLGEEYSGIVQVDDSYHKLPTFCNRLISILLSAFGENITQRLLRSVEKQIEINSTLRPAAQNLFLVTLKALGNILPQFESIHRALSYINGGPLEIGKTLTGINYVHVRPAAAAYYAHLRLLGIVTLLHAVISCGQNLYQAKKHLEQMADFPNEVDNSTSCVACLDEIVQPCVLQCGHFFCMQCCYGALESCALCRTPFSKNSVVPLMNYCASMN